MERLLKLTVAYDGTEFAGFQIQRDGLNTIQGELERAASAISGQGVRMEGAGRTDAGVHARGQVVSFRTASGLSLDRWAHALNAHLPRDIVVTGAEEVAGHFNARRSAKGKTYVYRVLVAPFPCPLRRRFVLHHPQKLDLSAIREGARFLVGTLDFASFRSAGGPDRGTVRTVREFTVSEEKDLLFFRVTGDGFLYRMVRNMVGTLLLTGEGRLSPQGVMQILEGRDRRLAGPAAPARGLCLDEVYY